MFGSSLRCPVCNQYAPDRCTCKKVSMKYKQVDPSFAYVDMTEDELKSLWKAYYPAGSGPLGAMRTICALVESIAQMRGFDVSKWSYE
jgi:hypothetical protein